VVTVGIAASAVVTAPAAAHETTTVEGYEVTFGGSDEPVVTDERMWLQVEVLDAETDEPVEGQAETLELSVRRPFGEDRFDLSVDGVHGRPGWYEGAVVFTDPGTYTVFVEGSIEGTPVALEFKKQVHDAGSLAYPPRTETGEADPGDTAIGFGTGVAITSLAIAGAFLVGRRL